MINFWHKTLGMLHLQRQGVAKALVDYFSVKIYKIYWSVALVLNLAWWVLAFLIKRNISQEIAILHYNITFGIDAVGSPWQIFLLPLAGLGLFIVNAALSLWLVQRDKLLVNMLLITAILGNLIIGLGLYAIYLVNFVNIF